MPDLDWVVKVKQYRMAVDAYCDTLDHMDSATDLDREWQRIEEAREEAERARLVLLKQRPKVLRAAAAQSWTHAESPDYGTDEWVLGDVGQHGG